jgi:phage-related protein
MSDGRIVIDTDLDTDKAERDFDRFQDKLRGSAGAFRGLGLLLGSSLTAPILSTGLVAMGALTASFASAGAGVLAFAAVAIPALNGVFEASEEIEKINEKIAKADTAKERTAALKELQMVMSGLTAKEREALSALQDFKTFWSGFAGQFKEPILDIFISSLGTLKSLITQLKPLFDASIPAIQGLFERLDNAVKNGAFKPFIDWMASNAGRSISNFGTVMGNVLEGVMNLMRAFSPLSAGMENDLVSLSQRFADWSAGLSNSKGFQDFVNYAKENGPLLRSVLSQLISILKQFAVALAVIAPPVLVAVNAILQFVNWLLQLHPAVGPTILSMAGLGLAIKALAPAVGSVIGFFSRLGPAIQKIGPFFTKLGTQLKTFGTTIMTALRGALTFLGNAVTKIASAFGRFVTLLPRIGQLFMGFLNVLRIVGVFLFTNPFGILILAITALVAAGIWLYQNWDTVKVYLIAAWNAIKAAGIAVWGWLTNFLSSTWATVKSKATSVWNSIKSFLSSTWNSIKSTASSVWNGIKSSLSSIINSIRSTMSNTWNSIKSTVSNVWNSIKSTASNAWNSIKSTISNGIRSAYNTVKGYASDFMSAGKALLDSLAKGISSGLKKAVGAVKDGMATIRSYLPFSPAKVGPLSDLDKSGESFFPTFASKMNQGMNDAISKVDLGLGQIQARLSQVGQFAYPNQGFVTPSQTSTPPVQAGDTYNVTVNNAPDKPTDKIIMNTLRREAWLHG